MGSAAWTASSQGDLYEEQDVGMRAATGGMSFVRTVRRRESSPARQDGDVPHSYHTVNDDILLIFILAGGTKFLCSGYFDGYERLVSGDSVVIPRGARYAFDEP